jgi:microcystin-dependent protein
MSDPFVAEIRIFGCNFAPTGWATCDGQLLPISQNTALFSLVGTFYGGNGQSTFALPNLQDSVPVQQGQGPGLSEYFLGQSGGTETVTLLNGEMPAHAHTVQCVPGALPGNNNIAVGNSFAKSTNGQVYTTAANLVPLYEETASIAGGDQPHNNLMPYLTLNFCIAMQGVFPSRG